MPTTSSRPRVARPDLRLLPVALATALAVASLGVRAQPPSAALPVVNGAVTPRNATIGPQAGTAANPVMNITQHGARGAIEWQSFDIGANARVNIVQPSSQSVLVNRVTPGGSASQIYGRLDANGRVFLVNTAGVTFGAGAQVNVGSLVASTLDLSPSFVANHYEALLDPASGTVLLTQGGGGQIQVASGATLTADPAGGGSVVLVGRQGVTQAGIIEAVRGQIAIGTASTAQVVLPASNSGFIDLVVTGPAAGRPVVDLAAGSTTRAAGGQVKVTGDNVQVAGSVSASAMQGRGGSVVLDAGPAGSVTLAPSGQLSATGERGGAVTVAGGSVVVAPGAGLAIDASGTAGGGTITVGGEQTRSVLVGQGRVLTADATDTGNGGRIVVLANHLDTTATSPVARQDFGVAEVYGTLLARGGVRRGDGGFVETSGRALSTRLDSTVQGRLAAAVDARARAAGGQAGTWVLDPFNVTIGNGLTANAVNQWTPTGTGAQINADDISAALNAGTAVEVNTGTAGVGAEAGTITVLNGTTISRTVAGDATTLTLRAHDSISLTGTAISAVDGAPLNVNLFSDLDGNGTGGVSVFNSAISTGGGNIVMSGGLDPTTGFARGSPQQAAVTVSGTRLTTDGAAGRGNVTLRGQGSDGGNDRGVSFIDNSSISANDTTILGLTDGGIGVVLEGANISTLVGRIDVRGVANRTTAGATQAIGLLADSSLLAVGSGDLLLAGGLYDNNVPGNYPAGDGLVYSNLDIRASNTSNNTLAIAGSASNSSGAGIRFRDVGTGGLSIVADASTNLPTLANVSIGAISSDGLALALGLDNNPGATNVLTNGTINFRPVRVLNDGQVTDEVGEAINVGPAGDAPSGFFVDPVASFGKSLQAGAGFVIGASSHSGAITVANGALSGLQNQSITLQNEARGEGGGSSGITLGTGIQVRDLNVLSTGNVTQTGGFAVGRSLVLGGGGNFTLTAAGNTVAGNVALANPNEVDLLVDGALVVGNGAAAATYDGNEGTFVSLALNDSTAGSLAVLRSSNGPVSTGHNVTVDGGQLTLVSPVSVTADGETSTLSANGGRVQVWSPVINWTPANRLNLYGCTYPACTLSGITPPDTGLQALFPTRPTVNVVAAPANGAAGGALPPLTYTFNGLQPGDDAATALAGALATTATAQSPAGTYAITQGTLTSPTGYLVNFTGAALTVAGQVATAVPLYGVEQVRSTYLAQNRSDVYGRNLALPFICTAQTVVRDSVAQESVSDPLASEWGKVRNAPNLSGCLDVTQGGQCAAF